MSSERRPLHWEPVMYDCPLAEERDYGIANDASMVTCRACMGTSEWREARRRQRWGKQQLTQLTTGRCDGCG